MQRNAPRKRIATILPAVDLGYRSVPGTAEHYQATPELGRAPDRQEPRFTRKADEHDRPKSSRPGPLTDNGGTKASAAAGCTAMSVDVIRRSRRPLS